MIDLVIVLCAALIGLWAIHGNTEANRVKLQNGSGHPERLKRSANVKKLIQYQQAVLFIFLGIFIQQSLGFKEAGAFLFYAAASRWFFFELFYGHYHLNDALYIGQGGAFDNEITANRLIYFFLRLFVLLLSIGGLIWAF